MDVSNIMLQLESRWMVLSNRDHLASNLWPTIRQSSYCDAKEIRPCDAMAWEYGARSMFITKTLCALGLLTFMQVVAVSRLFTDV
ncbi:hypothetical protein CFAM422_006417 [Trichoderma lentiforme]|uniref:Uncharacterized protein n=1 Tax=Trichoderma lentiforme TaxID=1567552 RepID=A0A9P5CBM4_9HYPO|nr:hypothetical protein CFAM422_006417 [Trichoderma lentiforme]